MPASASTPDVGGDDGVGVKDDGPSRSEIRREQHRRRIK